MTERRCETCMWWHRFPEGFNGKLVATLKTADDVEEVEKVTDYGQCRRMPPRISERTVQSGKRTPLAMTISEFPDTPRTAWCGEWSKSDPSCG